MTDITLTPVEHDSVSLPLVAAQPGIWMAEKLSSQTNAWSVAHYVELNGALDAPLLARAIVAGMMEADTLRMRFEERDGIVTQRFDASLTFATPDIIDLRREACPQAAAQRLMHADLEQDLRVTHGTPLAHHALLRVGETRWLWYQRYHHLVVDGFSFTAITRRIADIYRSLRRGDQPDASPFVPFKEVVEEYARYQASEACARDAAPQSFQGSVRGLRIFLEAGIHEPLILQANQRLVSLLQQTPQPLFWRQVEGGHDALCWRGGLTDGLTALWADALAPAHFSGQE
ncbi:Enterobactin synthetase component F, serine activating enzyme [Cronobacter universalis NCTC 9529]|nr:Enterobactin synthetase component F, serine activating enzyme [Cronobacter universalis NCTC 9529]